MGIVIQISDQTFRIKEKFDHIFNKGCQHKNTTMDEVGQTVRCDDCNADLNPYWVLKSMLESYGKCCQTLERDRQSLKEESATLITLRAAKEIQSAWKSKNMAPCCPHCHRGILPEDVLNGMSKVSKELEMNRRETEPKKT